MKSGLHHLVLSWRGYAIAALAFAWVKNYLDMCHENLPDVPIELAELVARCQSAPDKVLSPLGEMMPFRPAWGYISFHVGLRGGQAEVGLVTGGRIVSWARASCTPCWSLCTSFAVGVRWVPPQFCLAFLSVILLAQLEVGRKPKGLVMAFMLVVLSLSGVYHARVYLDESGETYIFNTMVTMCFVLAIAMVILPARYPLNGARKHSPCWRVAIDMVGTFFCLLTPLILGSYLQTAYKWDAMYFTLAATGASKAVQGCFSLLCAYSDTIPLEVASTMDMYAGGLLLFFVRCKISSSDKMTDVNKASLVLMAFELGGSLNYALWLRYGLVKETKRANGKRIEAAAAAGLIERAESRKQVEGIVFWRNRQFNLLVVDLETDAVVECSCLLLSSLITLYGNSQLQMNMPGFLDGRSLSGKTAILMEPLLTQIGYEALTDFFVGCILGSVAGEFVPTRMGCSVQARLALFGTALMAGVVYTSYGAMVCDDCAYISTDYPCRYR